ncbi:MAG TPA: hypothetical protein VHI13_05750, partial [Candidatus Kapabacteria bacterium]|nr:hypothetical protein [Candidatus Kapabacteria bacterium]
SVAALFGQHAGLLGQTDTIGGVINRYTRLRYIECTGNSAINVADPYGFHVGDHILIVQMKGAEIDKRDTSTFGTITQYNSCGNYELATIDQINGRTFLLHYELARTAVPVSGHGDKGLTTLEMIAAAEASVRSACKCHLEPVNGAPSVPAVRHVGWKRERGGRVATSIDARAARTLAPTGSPANRTTTHPVTCVPGSMV